MQRERERDQGLCLGGWDELLFEEGVLKERKLVVFGGCKCWVAVEMCPLVVGEKLKESPAGMLLSPLAQFFLIILYIT